MTPRPFQPQAPTGDPLADVRGRTRAEAQTVASSAR